MERFERHLDVPEIGVEGQKKLLRSSVLIVGLGGLGCPAALYLAAAGVGCLGLADGDTVATVNLQRQVLYGEADTGRLKAEAAADAVTRIFSQCDVRQYPFYLAQDNAGEIISQYDLILDCTDNFDARYLLNFYAFAAGKPLVSASLYHHDGQLAVFKPYAGAGEPCYQCLYPQKEKINMAPSCKEGGVVGPVAGVLGTMQASAALYELLGLAGSLARQMIIYSGRGFTSHKINIHKNVACSVCAQPKTFDDYHAYVKTSAC